MKKIALFCIVLFLSAFYVPIFSHPGKTDASGGHKDNKNISGLGSYHYHHGREAHLHEDGECPYVQKNEEASKRENHSGSVIIFPETHKAAENDKRMKKSLDDRFHPVSP